MAVELGHDAVLLVHEEGVWRTLEARGEGGGVLADVVGLGELLLLVQVVVWHLLLMLLLRLVWVLL